MSSSFSPVSLLRLAFRTPYSLLGWSEFSSLSVGVLSLLLGIPFLSFFFLPSLPFIWSFRFRSPVFFLTIRRLFCQTVSRYIRLSFSPVCSCFGASLPYLRFVCFVRFLIGFSVLYQLSSSVLSPPSPDGIPLLVCALIFSCFSLDLCDIFLFLFFSFISLVSLPQFRLLRCSSYLRGLICACFAFLFLNPRLCTILSRSLPVRSMLLSFFHSGFLKSFPDFARYFPV